MYFYTVIGHQQNIYMKISNFWFLSKCQIIQTITSLLYTKNCIKWNYIFINFYIIIPFNPFSFEWISHLI